VLAGRFASEVSTSADGTSIQLEQLQEKYKTLAVDLRAQYERDGGVGVEPYVGGVSRFEMPDFDIKEPSFGIGMDDNLRAGRQNYGRRGEIPDSWTGNPQDDW
jgi:hypothetical protein